MILGKHVYLVDGSGFVFRAYHALPPLTRSDGTPIGAVYGFTAMMLKLLDENQADYVAVVFDAARRTFRNDIYPQYKAHRPPPPEDLIPQFALIRDATRAFNLACVEQEGFEADDLIATYAHQATEAGMTVTVVSADKDLMQLVGDRVAMYDPIKGRPIGPEDVRAKFGVGPDKVVDVQALAGDSTDNVPGVPGIGIKTAAELIGRFGDVETLLAQADGIPQPKRRQALIDHADAARISLRLVTLRRDVPLAVPLADLARREPDPDLLLAFLKAQSFQALLARAQARVTARAAVPAMPETTAAAVTAARDYALVQTVPELDRWIARATAAGLVAVDTETDDLDCLTCGLVGVSLAVTPGEACYIPLRHGGGDGPQGSLDLAGAGGNGGPDQIPVAAAIAKLKPVLEDPGVLKVGHNIKFDMQVLKAEGIAVAPIDDTMVLSYVLDGTVHGHGMDELAGIHLGLTTTTFKEVCGSGRTRITFDKVPLDKACAYAAEDADVTLRLHTLLRDRLLAEHMVTVHETIERPLVPVLAEMERQGVKVDATELKRLSDDFAVRMTELEVVIHRLAGHPFNVASPKQLGDVLFVEMSLPGGKKSGKTGAYGTDAAVLEALAAQGHDLPARVLDWRSLAKLKSTYADALIACIDRRTGRVHTKFSQTVTSTGRLSSNDPNLQNIPVRTEDGRRIRRAFIAEPGHVLLSADYSQIELRLVAHVADIAALKQAFHEGADIHAITAAQVFGVPVEGMDPAVRRRAKAINFGIIYGISPFGLAAQLGIPQGDAKAYIDAYFARYPEIRTYMERTKADAREHGLVRTLFDRKVYTPGIRDKNQGMRNFAERAAINAPIQGGAADIIKRAMVRLPDALDEANLSARLLLQVHDELVLEVAEAEAERTAAVVRRVMEGAATLSVPLVVDTGTGANWAEAH